MVAFLIAFCVLLSFKLCLYFQYINRKRYATKENNTKYMYKLHYNQVFSNIKYEEPNYPSLKYKKYRILPIKYFKHYKSTQYMKRTTLSINMIGNDKQKTWQKIVS